MILGLTFFAALTGFPAECKMIHIYRKSSEKSTILMRHVDIAIILEAAGNSSRYGSNKLLHIMEDGRPMVCRMLDNARAQDPSRLILVTQYEEVVSLAPDFQIVMNHHPELGISRSMQLGIEAAGDADAYMFCVCDQPWLTPATVGRLIEEYRSGKAGIVSLAWQGKMCNPKIFSSRYREELMSLTGDTGGRQIISSHPDDLLLVEAASIEETMDIDRPIHTASTHSVSGE